MTICEFYYTIFRLTFLIPFVCVCVLWPPAAQNANASTDFANFDAFGSSAAATVPSAAAFPSAPQAPFQPAQTGTHTLFIFMIVHLNTYFLNLEFYYLQTAPPIPSQVLP